MNYLYNYDTDSLKERILRLNNTEEEIDISSFIVDYDSKPLVDFKKRLEEYRDKRFLIIGDYDCDGITSTTIAKKLLERMGISSNYYIPSRSKDGYGLSMDMVKMAIENGFEVLLLVDNGVKATEEVKLARDNGIRVLIIDHHEYEEIPMCDGFLHPNILEEEYKLLSAGGLCAYLYNSYEEDDYVTVLGGMSILSDMMPVFRYNRYLLKRMLEILNTGRIYQFNYLYGLKKYTYDDISYRIIPKINSLSRMDSNVNVMVKYLLASDEVCKNTAMKIESINNDRKLVSKNMYDEAIRNMEMHGSFIVVRSPLFFEGLCGVLANKLLMNHLKPVFVISETNGELRASGRSLENFNIYEYLNEISSSLSSFGGHAQAVGFSLDESKYQEFLSYLDANPVSIEEVYKPVLVLSQNDLNEESMKIIEELEPYGTSFKKPLLCIENPVCLKKYVIKNMYPKFTLGSNLSAISFNEKHLDYSFERMIGHLTRDSYRASNLSFMIEDLL